MTSNWNWQGTSGQQAENCNETAAQAEQEVAPIVTPPNPVAARATL